MLRYIGSSFIHLVFTRSFDGITFSHAWFNLVGFFFHHDLDCTIYLYNTTLVFSKLFQVDLCEYCIMLKQQNHLMMHLSEHIHVVKKHRTTYPTTYIIHQLRCLTDILNVQN